MNLVVTTSPSQEDLKALSAGIRSYNKDYLPDEVGFEKDTKFAVVAKDKDGEVLGGIRANAFWNYCTIELLWLSKKARGSGLGSNLMASAEKFAKDKGFGYMRTETTSFQAKPFYEKLGYRVFGELPDCPKGHATYCLVKEL
ncbi:MAG: GNAT family N-acetyltransferase [Gammaproteobacteria bacterium]|nr:GNAT family N-acetyltransferase [Gammaproteobacteria bacterium]